MTWTKTIPLVASFKASKGEKVIFNTAFDDIDGKRPKNTTNPFTDIPGPGPYETVFTCSADAEFDSAGSGLTTKTVAGKSSGNINLFIKNTWTGANAITVTATGKDKDPRTAANPYPAPDSGYTRDSDITYTWTINKRNKCPLTLTNVAHAGCQMHGGWVAAPALYAYLAGPDPAPDYQGESILETFGTCTSGGLFTMADLTTTWKNANPGITTPDAAAAVIFNSGGNGTFIIDANNKIFDQHSGFGDTTPFTATALTNGIGYRLPQSYKCEHDLGSYSIDRKYSTGAGVTIKKH